MKKILLIAITLFCVLFMICCAKENNELPTDQSTAENQPQVPSASGTKPNANGNITQNPTPPKLSEQCDAVLGEGYAMDGSSLEIVVKIEDAFPDSVIYFGVIKSNEWLVELTTNFPFIDENGRWIGLESYESNSYKEVKFSFIGKGCFVYQCNNADIVYKPETNVVFPINSFRYADPRDSTYSYNIMTDEYFVALSTDGSFYLHNVNTGEKQKIDFGERGKPKWIHPISDGLFLAFWDSFKGFFDVNGNLIIDLSAYKWDHWRSNYYDYYQRFQDGRYTFYCYNNNGVSFKTTIDKEGNIIHQEKVS